MVMLDELAQHALQVLPTEDQDVIEDLAPGCPTQRSENEFARGER